jgi:hypothetical protein
MTNLACGRFSRRLLCGLIGWGGAMLADPGAALAVTYPATIYPNSAEVRRFSEVPFAETAETLTYGFDTPFPTESRTTFLVENYGGSANGTVNNTGPFYDAVQAAIASGGPAEVVFGKAGRYYFAPMSSKGSDALSILNVRNANNLLIRGQGVETKLIFGGPARGGLCISDSTNVMIRDFSVDYNPLPFTQGVVQSKGVSSFVLRVAPGYPTPGAVQAAITEWCGGNRIANMGGKKWPAMTGLAPTNYPTLVSGNDWNFPCNPADSEFRALTVGTEFVYIGRRLMETYALYANHNAGFYLKNVSVYSSPCVGLCLHNNTGINVDGYADMIPTGSDRLLSSDADAFYSAGNRDGITLKNSYMTGQGDDCINLHCYGFRYSDIRRNSDTDITILTYQDIRPGDKLEIMNTGGDLIKGQLTVSSVIQVGTPPSSTRCILAAGLSTLGYNSSTDFIYPVSLASSDFKIVHNYFGQQRSGRILLGARNGLFEANTDENAEGTCVILANGGVTWRTGVIPSDVVIRSNLFRNVTGYGGGAAIYAWGGSQTYACRNVKNITIGGNKFINPRKIAINLTGCDGVVITNNNVFTASGKRNTWNDPNWDPVDCSIYLQDAIGVSVNGYTLTDPNITQCVLYIGNKCAAGTTGVTTNGITASIPGGVPIVLDARP